MRKWANEGKVKQKVQVKQVKLSRKTDKMNSKNKFPLKMNKIVYIKCVLKSDLKDDTDLGRG